MAKSFHPGVYAASLTWFSPGSNQELDEKLQAAHLEHLISSGLTGVILAGSNGEAVALNAEERIKLVRTARSVATDLGRKDLPIVIGTVGQTNRDIISQLKASHDAGASFGLVLTPDYFHFAMNVTAIVDFFTAVADASPIPILIYSWPLVTSGIEINSDIISALAKHLNIVGIKLTCGGIAKAVRIAAEFEESQFCALAGHSDWLFPILSCGGSGCISGLANICPKACVKLYNDYKDGNVQSATSIQYSLAKAEWGLGKAGINGTKWAAAKLLGYDLDCCDTRKPYPMFVDESSQKEVFRALEEAWAVENSLG